MIVDWMVQHMSSGSYTYNTQTVDGCDSTVTLNLTINNSSSSSEDVTACDITIGMVQHIRVLGHILTILKQ